MQETWVWSPVQEDPTCLRAVACLCDTLLSLCSRAWDPQLPKPTFRKARAHPQGSHYNKKPAHATKSSPRCITKTQHSQNEEIGPYKEGEAMFDSVTLVWKPLGPTWTQMGSPAASGLIDLCFPTSLAPLLSPHPGPGMLCALTALQCWSWWPGFDRVAALSVTNQVTLAKLLSQRMGVMSLPPHSEAGRTRVRVRALFFVFCF